jgi:hypothetical protein
MHSGRVGIRFSEHLSGAEEHERFQLRCPLATGPEDTFYTCSPEWTAGLPVLFTFLDASDLRRASATSAIQDAFP